MVTDTKVAEGFAGAVGPEQETLPKERQTGEKTEVKVEEQVDWKARAEEATKQVAETNERVAQLENNLKSLRGNKEREADIRAELGGIRRQLKFQAEEQGFIADRLLLEEDKPILKELRSKREKEARDEEQQRIQAVDKEGFQGWLGKKFARLVKKNTGLDDKPILDLEKAPELAEARTMWAEGAGKFDRLAVNDATDALVDIIDKAREERLVAAAKKAAKPKVEEEEMTDTGIGAGSTSASLESMGRKDTRRMSLKELRAYNDALDAAMRRGG